MSMRGVLRLGEVQIRVLDIEESKQHYGQHMGLHEMLTDDNGLVYFKAWDEKDHHSLVIRESDKAGVDHIAFKVYNDETLDDYERKLTDFGIAVKHIDVGVFPKSGRRLSFVLPTGHTVHLYAEKEYVGNSMGTLNPGAIPDEGVNRGFKINGLDHCLLGGPDIDENARLFREVFEFDLSEKIVDAENNMSLLVFLSCSTRAHDVAFVLHPQPGLFHHVSFRIDTIGEHVHASDLIGKYKIPVEMNDRHGVTRGKTVYFFDPSGNRNEVFCDGYTFYPDSPTLTWDTTDLDGAAFGQSRRVPESFLGSFT